MALLSQDDAASAPETLRVVLCQRRHHLHPSVSGSIVSDLCRPMRSRLAKKEFHELTPIRHEHNLRKKTDWAQQLKPPIGWTKVFVFLKHPNILVSTRASFDFAERCVGKC